MNPSIPRLDRIDRRLLARLQADGRISNTDLAQEVGLSQSACLRRVQSLQKAGVIEGYGALLNPAALGKSETVFIEITLSSQSEQALDAFERAAAASPDILECHLMAGDYDYLLRVAVADAADYERLHRKQLAAFPFVARIRSHFALRQVSRRKGVTV
ncbi:MAG: Lrp/AsnC family transcriptional regulator [Burkholderiaceae bacterium]|nr:Lrp/AsnC family transcriptional regulator [Burkholderiaceae bacterium]